MENNNNAFNLNLNDPFEKTIIEMAKLRRAKNKDYGNAFDVLFNEYGLLYSIMHLHEKLNRIKAVHKNNKANNESIKDSLIDLANYAIMTYILMDKPSININMPSEINDDFPDSNENTNEITKNKSCVISDTTNEKNIIPETDITYKNILCTGANKTYKCD